MFELNNKRVVEAREIYWEEACSIVERLHPQLVEIIDEISPGKDYPFYLVEYPFGLDIIQNGEIYLPLQGGGKISVNDQLLPKSLRDNLSYDGNTSNPLGLILDKNNEFYLSIGQRIMSSMIAYPGEIFGFARILDSGIANNASMKRIPSFPWDLRAGARSIFMLPKITDNVGHNKLKKYCNLSVGKPLNNEDHGIVFTNIAQKCNSPWRSRVLYFSNKLITKLKDQAFAELHNYLLHVHRSSYKIWHNNILIWTASFSQIELDKHLNVVYPYVLDTAKHLFTIAASSATGFRPAVDESSAPIKLIMDVYINGYGIIDLIGHQPIIMEPTQFTHQNLPIYYSLNHPTLTGYKPETKGKSIISLLDEVQRALYAYQKGIIQSDAWIKVPSLYNASINTAFSYFHNDPGDYENIKNNILLPHEDQRFICNQGTFPEHSPFLKGCIKISKLEK